MKPVYFFFSSGNHYNMTSHLSLVVEKWEDFKDFMLRPN